MIFEECLGMKFCPNCGHQLEEGAKFCPACGAQLTAESDQVSEKASVEQPEVVADTTVNSDTSKGENNYEEHRESQNGQANQQQLGFVGSVQYVVKHAFEFNGDVPESRKSVFWWAALAVMIFDCVAILIPGIGWLLGWGADVFLISACMRRLTYIGQNPKIGWLMIVPAIYAWPLVLMLFDKKAE